MIGKLRGIIDSLHETHAIIDVGGVGYIVFASGRTLSQLEKGIEVSLFIETHVREDHIHLYGFMEPAEQTWFTTLTTVKGVGAKVALGILSVLPPQQLLTAIHAQDKAAFKPVAGVGPKLAERIITELKSTVGKLETNVVSMPAHSNAPAEAPTSNAVQDAVSALTNLGYNRSEAFTQVTRLHNENPDATVESLIRDSLKALAV